MINMKRLISFIAAFFPVITLAAGYTLSVEIPGAPTTPITSPAQYISIIYKYSLGVGGLLALGVIVFGAVLYTTSAGNSSKQEEAKKWILGAIYGLLLLLAAYLILYTINPDLVKLKITLPKP